jgi:hypothetical protein
MLDQQAELGVYARRKVDQRSAAAATNKYEVLEKQASCFVKHLTDTTGATAEPRQ